MGVHRYLLEPQGPGLLCQPKSEKNIKIYTYICGANFPHLQPMAKLRRNQRGEIGCQHVKVHSCSHFSPCFDHTSPIQTDDGTSQIDHDIGAYVPYSFRTMSQAPLHPLPTGVKGWNRKGQQLNVTAQWCDHLNWEMGFTASMISPVFLKALVDEFFWNFPTHLIHEHVLKPVMVFFCFLVFSVII